MSTARDLHGPRRHAVPRGGLRQPPLALPPPTRGPWTRCGSSTASGWLAVVVTNQAGVARGYFPESLIHEVHALAARRDGGGRRAPRRHLLLPAPSRRSGEPPYRQDCDCRKPRPGPAAARGGRARRRPRALVGGRRPASATSQLAWSVGRAGRAGEERLRPGRADLRTRRGWPRPPDLVAEHLLEAVERILARTRTPREARDRAPSSGCSSVVRGFRGKRRVLVLADLVADEFVYGRVQRVSREAPVLILQYDGDGRAPGRRRERGPQHPHPGRRARCPSGVLGRDDHGARLRALLRETGIATRRRGRRSPATSTPVKTPHPRPAACTRPSSRSCASTGHAACRAQRRPRARVAPRAARVPGPRRRACWSATTASACSPRRWCARRSPSPAAGASPSPWTRATALLALPRHDRGHAQRARGGGGARRHDRPRPRAGSRPPGRTLLRRLGREGRAHHARQRRDGPVRAAAGPPLHIPIYGTDQVADVTGAGDTVIATFTLALAAGATPAEASRLANYAGGIVVMKRGTATVSAAELRRAVARSRSRAARLRRC